MGWAHDRAHPVTREHQQQRVPIGSYALTAIA
jgi:hypothetical protein